MKFTSFTPKSLFFTACLTLAVFGGVNHSAAQISTVTITVKDTAETPTSITSSAGNTLCATTPTTLTVNGGSTGTSGQWEWFNADPVTGSPIPGATGNTYNVTPPVGTTTYYARATNTCNTTNAVALTITVNPTPTLTAILSNQTHCFGATVPVITLNGNTDTFTISGGAGIGLANQTVNNGEIPTFTATNTTSAPLTATLTITPKGNGCDGTPSTFTITVMPQVTVVPVASQTVCPGATVVVPFTGGANNPTSSVTYNWAQTNTAAVGSATSGTGDMNFTATNATTADLVANYKVTPVYTNGATVCEGTSELFTITVRPTPMGTLTAAAEVCEGQPIQLTFTATAGTGPFDLEIRPDNAAINTLYNDKVSGTAFDITPVPTSGSHTYDLMKITDDHGCVKQ